MDAWLVNQCRTKNIEIVEAYNQSIDPDALSDDLTNGGWCLGMTMDWLRCKRNYVDFWTSFHKEDGKERIRFIMARQAIISKWGRQIDIANKMQVSLKSAGLSLQSSEREKVEHISSANICNSFSGTRGRYVYLIIGGPGGAHAIGLFKSQTQIVLMDPNSGEFVFPSISAFRAWLSIYLTGMNYASMGLLVEYQMDAFS